MSSQFDPRAWLAWGVAMSLAPMLGRNPLPLITVLVVAIAVRSGTRSRDDDGWNRLVKLALVMGAIGVLFNLATYHGGDRAIGSIPGWIPVFGGAITLNAVVFGLLSGLAIVTLILVWSTVAGRIEWSSLIRLTPPGLSGLAVSSSIAITLVPKTIESFSEIRDVQAIRGFPMKGPRDLLPLVSPLLTLGLERSVTYSEALESRGFGGPEPEAGHKSNDAALIAVGLTALAVAAFLIVSGREPIGLLALFLSAGLGWLAIRNARSRTTWRPTRYRPVELSRADRIVIFVSLVSAIGMIAVNRFDRLAFFYEPYPTIGWPHVNLVLILLIALLLAPLAVTTMASVDPVQP